jgi:hypothetical protein
MDGAQMNDRDRLPNRRPNSTVKLKHKGMTFYVTVGFDPVDGKIKEVFGNAHRASTDIDYLISDSCVAISIALQMGATPELLLHSMSFVDVVGDPEITREPASIMGKIVQAIIVEQTIPR